MAVNFIKSEAELTSLLRFISSAKKVSFDTEFFRETTFLPKLGLLQLMADGEIFLVDPLELKEFYKIIELLIEGDALTICHAGTEDLEIFANIANEKKLKHKLPQNLYDTQVAAMFLNRCSSIGLASILTETLGITLAKTETRTNWLARPFSEAQIEYAAMDVAYLEKLVECFDREFAERAELKSYFNDEMNSLSSSYDTTVDPSKLYLQLSGTGNMKRKQLKMLKALCELRYKVCVDNDIAPSRFLRNGVLIDLVKTSILEPQTYIKKGVHYSVVKTWGSDILATAQAAFDDEAPVLQTYDAVNFDDRLKPLISKLKSHLMQCTKKLAINKDLLCSKRLVQNFFYNHYYLDNAQPAILEQGWRKEAVGDLSSFLLHKPQNSI